MGQKRYFLRDFTEVLKQVEGEIDTVVDLFGGSGLLSHTAKNVLPGCRVVYNDFDRYVDYSAPPNLDRLLAEKIITNFANKWRKNNQSRQARSKRQRWH